MFLEKLRIVITYSSPDYRIFYKMPSQHLRLWQSYDDETF